MERLTLLPAISGISTASLKTMITEHDTVVLTKALPAPGLEEGDIGAVVHVYEGQKALEVEFVTASGSTVAVETLALDDVRPPDGKRSSTCVLSLLEEAVEIPLF